jgi:hypothetical protein
MRHCLQSSVLQDIWSHKFESSAIPHYEYTLYISNTLSLGTGQRTVQWHSCCMKLTNSFPSAFIITFTTQPFAFTEQTMAKIEPKLI